MTFSSKLAQLMLTRSQVGDLGWRLLSGTWVAAIGLVLSQLGLLQQAELLSYNLLFQLRGARDWDDRIVLVAIDDASIQQLGRYPWPRQRFVQLIQQLNAAEPAAIAVDLIFSESTAEDRALAAALQQNARTVLAQAIDSNNLPLPPNTELADAAADIGHIYRYIDGDGTTRQIPLTYQGVNSLSLATVAAYGFQHPIPPLPTTQSRLWLNWPGPTDRLTTYSFQAVINQQIPAAAFRDKIVLIGVTATGFDTLATPFNRNPTTTGVYLHAAAMQNLLQQNALTKLNPPWLLWLLLGAMPLFSWLLSLLRAKEQVALSVLLLVLWWAGAIVGLHQGYWLLTILPSCLILGTAATVAVTERWRMNAWLQQQIHQVAQTYLPQSISAIDADCASLPLSQPAALRPVQQLTALTRQLAQAQMTQVAIAQSLAIGVVAFECPDGRVRFANRTACDWLPIQPGDNLRDCLIPQWLTAWPEKTDQPAPIEVQQGDRWFTLQFVWAAPLSNDCLLILEDCTARKQLEANLNKQIQELQWLAKLRDDMIGSISHELRSPLTNMLLAIELLKTAQSQTEAERHMQILEAECLRERDFINDLLSLQNSQPLRRSILIQPLNLADWLQDILTPFQARAATRQQTITYRCEPGLPLLQTDAISLERICKELITNACKYTPVGESIVIQVFRQAPNICISVKNLGVTIPPAELPRIFEKFYRIPESDPWKQGGTGMGLAIVQRLAQQIKAEITVQSESDVTEFLLRIPVNLPLSDSFDPD